MFIPPRNNIQAGRLRASDMALPARAVLALFGAMASLPCHAALSDTIHPFAALTYSYDSNLLRLPDDQPGVDVRSDTLRAGVAGLSFERPVGRQLFTGSAKVTRVSFDHFNQLDYNGKDASLDWQWQLGNHWSGNAGGTYAQSLTPFTDFHSSERNLRVQRGRYVEADWRVLADWQLHARTSHNTFDYNLSSQRYLDRIEDANIVGFDYLGANGNTVGLQATRIEGKYPNKLVFGQFVFDQGYTQDKLQLKVHWNLSGVTQLEFLGGRAKRTHDVFSQLDASGTNGRVKASWAPHGNLHLTSNVWREFVAFEGSNASYSLNKGASIGATWNATAKIKAEANYRYERRDFPGLVGAAVPLNGRDTTRGTSAVVTYAPTNSVQLVLSLTQEERSASQFISSAYRTHGASFTASLQF